MPSACQHFGVRGQQLVVSGAVIGPAQTMLAELRDADPGGGGEQVGARPKRSRARRPKSGDPGVTRSARDPQ